MRPRGTGSFTGTGTLTRLAFRRDRITLPAWVLTLAALLSSFTAMTAQGMPTQRDVVQETQLMAGNTGMRLIGLASGANVGGYALIRGYVTLAVAAALMSILAVVRHTRQNEELGRAELLGATVVGRYAPLASGVVVAVTADAGLALLMPVGELINGQPVAGSFIAGAAVAAVGVAFTGVAAVTAQLSSTTRGASGLAAAVVGVAFLVAGVGNMLGSVRPGGIRVDSAWPVWLSPIGWGQQMRAFGGDHWWPLGLFAVLLVVLLAVAFTLVGRRDTGRGLLPERRGRARAPRALLSPFGLVWRLQRAALLAWAAGMLTFGLILGSISGQVDEMEGAARDYYAELGAGKTQIVDAFCASIIQIAGMAAGIYLVQILLRMRAEEAEGRLEPVLATAVNRPRWMLGHVLNACLGAAALMLIFGVSMAVTVGQANGDSGAWLRKLVAAALVQLPGLLVVGGIVIAVVGLLPRWSGPVSWTVLMASLLVGPLFGPMLSLPQQVMDLSPFTHVPMAPLDQITALPVVLLLGCFAALAVVGFAATRRRNLVLPA